MSEEFSENCGSSFHWHLAQCPAPTSPHSGLARTYNPYGGSFSQESLVIKMRIRGFYGQKSRGWKCHHVLLRLLTFGNIKLHWDQALLSFSLPFSLCLSVSLIFISIWSALFSFPRRWAICLSVPLNEPSSWSQNGTPTANGLPHVSHSKFPGAIIWLAQLRSAVHPWPNLKSQTKDMRIEG